MAATTLSLDPHGGLEDMCPCRRRFRWLEEGNDDFADADDDDDVVLWEVLFTCAVLTFMFGALVSDRMGADMVMMVALTAFMASEIITVAEGLVGFSNEGLLTVLTLFVVAEGISKTGALDWYMGKLLGRPETTASAQLRLMAPIAIVSAFLNNTPVVAVMIPIVQRWAKNIHISAQQLLIPLSFASILGGTCTLIGTSTNLVVVGLLKERYPDNPDADIGLFELGQYGVPIAMAGLSYILLTSPVLLPGGAGRKDSGDRTAISLDNQEDVLLGARLAPWSPAAGRSVKRSGLRDTGGIYLVSVHRAATGNVHRAVGQEFVLNVGDILYFTGLVEGFGEFCEEHGMEILTNEIDDHHHSPSTQQNAKASHETATMDQETQDPAPPTSVLDSAKLLHGGSHDALLTVVEGEDEDEIPVEVGVTKESLMQAGEAERSRAIARMIDLIRGLDRDEPQGEENRVKDADMVGAAHKVVVVSEHEFVIVGVNARDRPGLMLDISKGISRLNLNLRHTEASVVGSRSISIWRCEVVDVEKLPDLEEIWSVLNALLESDVGSQAIKQRGLRVLRAIIAKNSSLVGKAAADVDFRGTYKAAVVAIQKGGRNVPISGVHFGSGDVLVLQVSDDSPLLNTPPPDFYNRLTEANKDATSKSGSVASFVNRLTRTISNKSLDSMQAAKAGDDKKDLEAADNVRKNENANSLDGEEFFIGMDDDFENGDQEKDRDQEKDSGADGIMIADMAMVDNETAWKDLQVLSLGNDKGSEDGGKGAREFLMAMQVAPKSKMASRTVAEIGLDKLPGVFLVSIDRPANDKATSSNHNIMTKNSTHFSSNRSGLSHQNEVMSVNTLDPIFTTISPDMPLEAGDVLWFAGSASAVGDLRKIPGLLSFESEEVAKINEKVHDRRLVEAVVARRGPLVGKTVKEARFRTRFGAAVIAVHRDGKRIHDHPGKIKLQAGDVLLMEAGPTFIRRSVDNDRSFALLAEVEDSAPPRLSLLLPALAITATMLAVFTAGVASLLVCALVASILMVALGILSEQEARDAVNWEVFITIAAAFGIGIALVNSGVAGGIANFLVDVGGAVGMGGAVYFATFLISNVVTNNAAAALLFPIAMDAAEQTGADTIVMSYCLMLGASASFMSPFGYTTNLLIYGPGGYKYRDFLVVGTPMQLVLWILSILFLATMTASNWWISWLGTFLVLLAVVASRTASPASQEDQEHPVK